MNENIVDTHGGHARHKSLPFTARVERDEKPKLCAGKKQIFVLWILPDHVYSANGWQIPGDGAPRRAIVTSDEERGVEILQAVPVNGEITRLGVKVWRLYSGDI